MKKSSKSTINNRVTEISQMLIEGKSRASIIHYGSETWKVGERQIDKYISKARILIQKEVTKNLEYDYAKALCRYEELYRLSIAKKDFKTALLVNKELTTLQGLKKVELKHSGEVHFVCSIPD